MSPPNGVILHIFHDSKDVLIITYDMIVIILLPEPVIKAHSPCFSGHKSFECEDKIA